MSSLSASTSIAAHEREFRTLVEPYRRALERHCYRMLASAQDAEDATQEALLRAWHAFPAFERRATVKTWLYRIATNVCLDEIARRPRRAVPVVDPYPDDVGGAPAIEEDADPAARYARQESMQLAFLTAIQRLPGRQRAVLILRDVLGWSAAETAGLLDTTAVSVNSALQRARSTIDRELPARSPTPAPGAHRDLLRRYMEAWERADVDGLVALLREDAVLSMPPQPSIVGAEAVVAFFARVDSGMGRSLPRPMTANGRPAVALRERTADGGTRAHRLLVLDVGDDGRVAVVHAYADAAVLRAFGV